MRTVVINYFPLMVVPFFVDCVCFLKSYFQENREREYHGNGWWPKTPVSNGSQQVRDLKTPEKLADLGGKQGGSHPERRPQKPVHASTGAGATNQSALI